MNVRTIQIHAGLWLLLMAGLILTGCAPKQRAVDDSFALDNYLENVPNQAERLAMTPEERFAYDYRTAAMARMREEGVPLSSVHLVERAKTAIGTPYVRGGTSMSGFDCSGFVQWAYKSVGVKLPRTAREQSVLGTPIDFDEMEAGDIVAFRHPRRGYHTGIYVGDGKFIHSPRRGKTVEITSLNDPYFSSTFLGARRVSVSESDAEAAQKLMAMYESRSHRRAASDATLSKRASAEKKAHKASYSKSKKSKQKVSASRSSSKHKKAVVSKKKGRATVAAKRSSRSGSVKASQSRNKQVAQKRTSQTSKKSVSQKRSSQKNSSASARKKTVAHSTKSR
ncbi:C40 family peptidase [uncultured Bilophila sp.]|uniref:C40 family peptidase n=1 Tax=uncultured Bilophila sp. TaxID=529385 RepID=UPI0025CDAA3D|nr:NlpC/P60 family protein [uncultured Bilophila sp.]